MIFKAFGSKKKDPHPWMADIRSRFPDWPNRTALDGFPEKETHIAIGQWVTGEVIAVAPSGTWLDIGATVPALLHFFNREDTDEGPPRWNNGPEIGAKVVCRIASLSDHSDISVTQRDSNLSDDNSENRSQ
jgi:hypothetical protein